MLVGTLAVLFLIPFAFAAECEFQKGNLYGIEEVMTCLDKLPLDKNDFKETLYMIEQVLDSHAFLDVLKEPPHPYEGLQVDLKKEIKDRSGKIAGQEDLTFRAAHEDLSALFRRQRDPHAVYSKPTCLGMFTAALPFSTVGGPMIGNERSIYIRPHTNSVSWVTAAYDEQHGTKLADLLAKCPQGTRSEACRIKTINEAPADQFIDTVAEDIGYISKSRPVLFNEMVGSSFFMRNQRVFNPPLVNKQPEKLKLVMGDETQLDIDWSMFVNRDGSKSLEELAKLCLRQQPQTDESASDRFFAEMAVNYDGRVSANDEMKPEDVKDMKYTELLPLIEKSAVDVKAKIDTFENEHCKAPQDTDEWSFSENDMLPVVFSPASPDMLFFYASNCQRHVLFAHVATFMPSDDHLVAFSLNLAQWARLIRLLGSEGIDRYAVSVVGNGGGIITLGYGLANLLGGAGQNQTAMDANMKKLLRSRKSLFPEGRLYPLSRPYDFRISPAVSAINITTADYREPFIRYLTEHNEEGLYNSADSEKEQRTKRFKSENVQYSGVGQFAMPAPNSQVAFDLLIRAQPDMATITEPGKILVLTSGYCGSTCATFMARVMEPPEGEAPLAQVIAFGGRDNEIPSASSFPGGSVLDSEFVLNVTGGKYGSHKYSSYIRFPATALYPFASTPQKSAASGVYPSEFIPTMPHIHVHEYFADPRLISEGIDIYSFITEATKAVGTKCQDGMVKTVDACLKQFPHASSAGYKCEGGRFTDTCVVQTCKYGYMTIKGEVCQPSPYVSIRGVPSNVLLIVIICVICACAICAITAMSIMLIRRRHRKDYIPFDSAIQLFLWLFCVFTAAFAIKFSGRQIVQGHLNKGMADHEPFILPPPPINPRQHEEYIPESDLRQMSHDDLVRNLRLQEQHIARCEQAFAQYFFSTQHMGEHDDQEDRLCFWTKYFTSAQPLPPDWGYGSTPRTEY